MIVPNGVLFDTGVAARIKQELLENFNLHTIVRLPRGVFAPYTDIETNLLFFERDGTTNEIWYYEHPLPAERRSMKNPCYTKTKPLRYEEFSSLQQWWNDRKETEHAWKVLVEEVAKNEYNLDIKNPNSQEREELSSPIELVDDISHKEQRITEVLQEIKKLLELESEWGKIA